MTEATNNASGQPRKVQVSAEPLRQVLHALINAPHLIRELQATREPVALFADNPINVLIAEFEAGVAAPPAAAVVMPPSPYMPDVDPENLTDYERGEAQGRCDMWTEVARLNPGADHSEHALGMVPADHVEQSRAMVVPDGEREAFEYGLNPHCRRRNEHGDYVVPEIQDRWCGWQARAALSAPAAWQDVGALEADLQRALKALNVAVSVYDVELADAARKGLSWQLAALAAHKAATP